MRLSDYRAHNGSLSLIVWLNDSDKGFGRLEHDLNSIKTFPDNFVRFDKTKKKECLTWCYSELRDTRIVRCNMRNNAISGNHRIAMLWGKPRGGSVVNLQWKRSTIIMDLHGLQWLCHGRNTRNSDVMVNQQTSWVTIAEQIRHWTLNYLNLNSHCEWLNLHLVPVGHEGFMSETHLKRNLEALNYLEYSPETKGSVALPSVRTTASSTSETSSRLIQVLADYKIDRIMDS